MRLIGRYFQGVISSRGSSPYASQDVAKVFPERARISVADGAGDTGAVAGEWASLLTLCYGTSQDAEPEWLDRAVRAWTEASNLSHFKPGSGVNQQELSLLQHGVDASFIGAAFADLRGALSVNWVAAGDCEAFLFRGKSLKDHGPVLRWNEFSSTIKGINSNRPQPQNLSRKEWYLEEGDTLILCSDALGQFILKKLDDKGCAPNEVVELMQCTEWQELRRHVEAWRANGLRNDDVAVVRVSIDRGPGVGRFLLTQETSTRAQTALATAVWRNELSPRNEPSLEQSSSLTEEPRHADHEPPTNGEKTGEISWGRFLGFLGIFVLGFLVAKLPWQSQSNKKMAKPADATQLVASTGRIRVVGVAATQHLPETIVGNATGAQQRADVLSATKSENKIKKEQQHAVGDNGSNGSKKGAIIALPKGARLYETVEGKAPLLLKVAASHAVCVADSSSPAQVGRRVTINAWVNAGPRVKKGYEPEWLRLGRVPNNTEARTAPWGTHGGEYLGVVRKNTRFTVGKREDRKGELWIELRITGYQPAK